MKIINLYFVEMMAFVLKTSVNVKVITYMRTVLLNAIVKIMESVQCRKVISFSNYRSFYFYFFHAFYNIIVNKVIYLR